MTVRTIDINADLGESLGNWRMGNDEALIPQITSANVACGFHASDPVTMLRTVKTAHEHGVAIGAHPGLPDLIGFGRRTMSLSGEEMYAAFAYQIGALQGVLKACGLTLHHVKPHGVLPAMLRDSEELGVAAAEALVDLGRPLVYFPAPVDRGAFLLAAKERGIPVAGEIYPDLSYTPEGRVVVQRQKRATDLDEAAAQVRRFLSDGCVLAEDGSEVPMEAESICVHGDGPNAADVARAVRRAIEESGCAIGPVQADAYAQAASDA